MDRLCPLLLLLLTLCSHTFISVIDRQREHRAASSLTDLSLVSIIVSDQLSFMCLKTNKSAFGVSQEDV